MFAVRPRTPSSFLATKPKEGEKSGKGLRKYTGDFCVAKNAYNAESLGKFLRLDRKSFVMQKTSPIVLNQSVSFLGWMQPDVRPLMANIPIRTLVGHGILLGSGYPYFLTTAIAAARLRWA